MTLEFVYGMLLISVLQLEPQLNGTTILISDFYDIEGSQWFYAWSLSSEEFWVCNQGISCSENVFNHIPIETKIRILKKEIQIVEEMRNEYRR
jgi:hypothetical protein